MLIQVARELVVLKHEARLAPELLYDKKRGIVLRLYTMTAAKEVIVHPADLRARFSTFTLINKRLWYAVDAVD